MNTKDLLKTIITDSQARPLPELWKRNLTIPQQSGKIVTLTGVRRSGKTYHLFQVMRDLLDSGVAPERLLYINFEDERLDIDGKDMGLILEAYQELYPELIFSDCYFFFDEVQEIQGWEKFVDRIYSTVSQRVFITGSNSKLLSREIATALRGRTITFEVYPLSFSEFTNVVQPGLNLFRSVDKAKLAKLFERFMYQGGFPELVHQEEGLRERILQEYFNVMLLRDLVERYQVSSVAILKYFCKRLIGASAGEFSVNKVYNELKSQGYRVSKDSLYGYQENVEAIYLCRLVPKYSSSVVRSESSQKKAYVIDSGLGAALDFKLSQDQGRLFETTVALELIKQGKQIAYHQGNGECDFVVTVKGQPIEAIQVSVELSDEITRRREVKGLVECCKQLGISSGTILSLDTNEQIESDGIKIVIIPAWSYFSSAN